MALICCLLEWRRHTSTHTSYSYTRMEEYTSTHKHIKRFNKEEHMGLGVDLQDQTPSLAVRTMFWCVSHVCRYKQSGFFFIVSWFFWIKRKDLPVFSPLYPHTDTQNHSDKNARLVSRIYLFWLLSISLPTLSNTHVFWIRAWELLTQLLDECFHHLSLEKFRSH